MLQSKAQRVFPAKEKGGKHRLPPPRGNHKKGKSAGGKGGGDRGGGEALSEALSLITTKKLTQQKQMTREMIAQAGEKIVIKEDRKKKTLEELAAKLGGDKKKARIIVKQKNYKIDDGDSDIDDFESDDVILSESQGELVGEYIAADGHLSFLQKQR